MNTLTHKELLKAGVHFGHMTRKWHPNMAPFIFMKRNGVHIIDINKTLSHLQEASQALKSIARAGKKILFVATKKQAQAIIEEKAKHLKMPYVTERWLGGTLTNFATIRRLLKKMSSFDKLMKDAAYKNMAKKEQLMIAREKNKLTRLLQGIADVSRLPSAIFVIDIKKEHIAVKEAQKLGIPVFAITDTNTNPLLVDYPIPGNDDAACSIALIAKTIASAIEEGLLERQKEVTTAEQEGSTTEDDSQGRHATKILPTEKAEKQPSKSAAPYKAQSTSRPRIGQKPLSQTGQPTTRPKAAPKVISSQEAKPAQAHDATLHTAKSPTSTSKSAVSKSTSATSAAPSVTDTQKDTKMAVSTADKKQSVSKSVSQEEAAVPSTTTKKGSKVAKTSASTAKKSATKATTTKSKTADTTASKAASKEKSEKNDAAPKPNAAE